MSAEVPSPSGGRPTPDSDVAPRRARIGRSGAEVGSGSGAAVEAHSEKEAGTALTDQDASVIPVAGGARIAMGAPPSRSPSQPADSVDVLPRALDTLPLTWQRVLWYCEVLELKPNEAASLLGMAPTALLDIHHRARTDLRAAYLKSERSWTGGRAAQIDGQS